jgi:hypothetical protein
MMFKLPPPSMRVLGRNAEEPISRPERGGEWELIKILLEGDRNSNKMN